MTGLCRVVLEAVCAGPPGSSLGACMCVGGCDSEVSRSRGCGSIGWRWDHNLSRKIVADDATLAADSDRPAAARPPEDQEACRRVRRAGTIAVGLQPG